MLPQEALACNAANSVDMHGLTADDRILTTLPLFHVGGLNILTTPALQAGCTVVLHPRFDPEAALAAIERERITLTVVVPAVMDALMALLFLQAHKSGLSKGNPIVFLASKKLAPHAQSFVGVRTL